MQRHSRRRLLQTQPEDLPLTTFRRVRGFVHQDTDAPHPPRLLRGGGERRGEETASQATEERSPVYH